MNFFKKIQGIVLHAEQQKVLEAFHAHQQKILEKFAQEHEEAESKEKASSPDAGDATKPVPVPGKDFSEFKFVANGEAWLLPATDPDAVTQWKIPEYKAVSAPPQPAATKPRCACCYYECVYCSALGTESPPSVKFVRKREIEMLPGVIDLMKEVEWGSNSQGLPECPWCRAADDHYNCVCRRDPKNSPHEASVPKHLKDCPAAILLRWERS